MTDISHRNELIEAGALPEAAPPGRIRLALISQVTLDSAGNARPIHMLRVGTFTDSSGKPCTFGPEHIQSIIQNYDQRPNCPITESHDWGRAVGRTTALYSDPECMNLYGLPKWNTAGQQLIADGVYDGYSCELDPDGKGGFVKIGGSLTNYPAVHGLTPVSLAAPSIDSPLHIRQETPIMAEPEITPPPVGDVQPPAPAAFVAPPPSGGDGAIFQAQMDAALRQMQAQYEAQASQALQSAQLQFERWKVELAATQEIAQFAQHVTTPTMQRPYALPLDGAAVVKFMTGLGAEARKDAKALFESILTSGLVSFEEIGSSGAGAGDIDAVQAYEDALSAELKINSVRSVALSNLRRKQPAIVAAYNEARASKKGAT
jgi:hypothetical protein